MTLIPREHVPAPAPGELRYGLFAVAPPSDTLSSHGAGGGVVYLPDFCGPARPYAVDCPPGEEKDFDLDDGETQGLPFAVIASLLCGSVGFSTDEWNAKIRGRLTAGEQGAAEMALWTGRTEAGGDPLDIDAFNTFGAATALTPGDDSSIVSVVAELENFAYLTADYGYRAVIHAPVSVSPYAADHGLVVDDGGVKRTPFGSRWVFGGGYPGTAEDTNDGDTAGTVPAGGTAIYVTGQVSVWRTPDVFVAPRDQLLDRATNQQYMLAERGYAVTYDCLLGEAIFTFPAGGS